LRQQQTFEHEVWPRVGVILAAIAVGESVPSSAERPRTGWSYRWPIRQSDRRSMPLSPAGVARCGLCCAIVRRTVAAVVVVAAVLGLEGVAHARDTTFDFVDDTLAGFLRPGQAEVAVAATPATYSALAGIRVGVQVSARPRGRLRPGRTRRVFVRFKSPPARCAGSYARDHGTIVARPDPSDHGPPPRRADPRGMLGAVRRSGDVIVGTGGFDGGEGKSYRWRRPQTVRFCIWLGRKPKSPIKPITQDVQIHGPLFGAAMAHTGSFDPFPAGFAFGLASNVPFRLVWSHPTPDPLCGAPTQNVDVSVGSANGTYQTGSLFGTSGAVGCRGGSADILTFSPLSAAGADLAAGSLTFRDVDVDAPVAISPIRHFGSCNLAAAAERSVVEAISYLNAVGCTAGRTIVRPRPKGTVLADGKPHSGELYAFSLHGGVITLAPAGTQVDLMVDP
jgi:hypothetical protein